MPLLKPNVSDPDLLSSLLQSFLLTAGVFHTGTICGVHDFQESASRWHLHLIVRGPVDVIDSQGRKIAVPRPAVILASGDSTHRLVADTETGAQVVCAHVELGGKESPVFASLANFLLVDLSDLPGAAPVVDLLVAEAFDSRAGRRAVLNRLCELLVVHLFRFSIDNALVQRGALAGLGDARLAKALGAVHQAPARAWSLEAMASLAGMSRARFSARFHAVVGTTPADYLAAWRIEQSLLLLRTGKSLKQVALDVGYGSASAFTRAFTRKMGCAPTPWLKGAAGSAQDARSAIRDVG